ncbi:MAG: hypothetical protein P8R42_28055 [Candidatus Binatia bacterium]|nr:hypothetical protein [Candidatus Binatia bacterium]
MKRVTFGIGAGALLALLLAPAPSRADGVGGDEIDLYPVRKKGQLEEPPAYGVPYDKYEPSFYTGFAPRSLEPSRVHLHLGRGNQLRVTEVLSEEVIDDYVRDLAHRRTTYGSLAEKKRIVLTQNTSFDEFETRLGQVDIGGLVAQEASLSAEAIRARNLALMAKLNPGRVFRIDMPTSDLVRRWMKRVRPEDAKGMKERRRLQLLNGLLPTRLWHAKIDGTTTKELRALVKRAVSDGDTPSADVTTAYLKLLARVSGGMYPQVGDSLQFVEFTAIYPVGSFNEFTEYRGRKIPMYPTPGRRALTTHQRTKTVDHIPDKAVYGYFPWIPYMHVGDKLHNSFHTLWWKMEPPKTDFLPSDWHDIDRGRRGDGDYRYLWLLSRGPMSHGCTHVNAGHISELRQVMPSEAKRLYEIDTFLNKSHLYDVFDIDGDGTPEVMGVRYFIAFSLKNKKAHKLRVRNERKAFYDWLYGGELLYREDGTPYFKSARDGQFVGRTAIDGFEYDDINLYEAEYEAERIQFYRMIDIGFARELRKVGVRYPFPENKAG